MTGHCSPSDGRRTGHGGLPATMPAAFVTELGSADHIRIGELPLPRRGASEVLVRVTATTVDMVDTFVRSGAYATPTPFPFVVGRDLVGEVVEAPEGSVLREGEQVWCNSMGHGGRQGAAAGFAAVPVDRVQPVPVGVDAIDLLCLAHPATTAQLALFTHGRLAPGETVLVCGGAGHVGRAAVQLAAAAGARVVATASSDGLAACRRAGAAVALDRRAPDLGEQLRSALPHGVDVHLDTSGQDDLERGVDLLAPRGRMVLMAGMARCPELPVGRLYTKDASLVGFAISNAGVDELAAASRRVASCLADGVLTASPHEVRPLAAMAQAHRDVEARGVRGRRIVLHPWA